MGTVVSVHTLGDWESIATFSDKVNFDYVVEFAAHQFEMGNSLTTPGDNIAITDAGTGAILWDWQSESGGIQEECLPGQMSFDDFNN